MLDVFNLVNESAMNIQKFYATDATSWQVWTKPRNATIVFMICIGGGGGGSCGGNVPGERYGGAGGGSGGISRLTVPAIIIPDTLFVQPGIGGAGTTIIATTGGTGGISYVSVMPDSNTANLFLASSTAGAGGGTGAPSGVTGRVSEGAGGTVALITATPFALMGKWTANAGGAGNTGGTYITAETGFDTKMINNCILTGGSGGGSGTFAGGSITTSGQFPALNPGSTGDAGSSGWILEKPFSTTGGVGGGGNTGGTGGDGGNAAIGSGGGGGGSGIASGVGGNGGSGLVIIATW